MGVDYFDVFHCDYHACLFSESHWTTSHHTRTLLEYDKESVTHHVEVMSCLTY